MKTWVCCSVVILSLAACSKPNGSSTGASPSASAATPTASQTTAATAPPSLLDKALSFLSGGPFEGDVTMSLTQGDKAPETIVYSVKGTKMRFDVPAHGAGAGSYAIFDSATKKMTTVTDAKKMASVMDLGSADKLGAAVAGTKPKVEKTGKEDVVAGYKCDVWKITEDNGNSGEACMASGIAFPAAGPQTSWAAEMGNAFPLRMSMNDKAGKPVTKMEVTKIEKKKLDDKTFEVPAGYHTMDLTGMLKGLGGLSGMKPPH